MKVLFLVVNVDWFFLSHRLPIALHAIKNNYQVYLLTADTGRREEIERYGIHFIEVPFQRSGKNIFHEIKCIFILTKLYKKYSPNIIHQVTLKASILGSIAAKRAKIKNVVNAISGFGYNFTNERKGLFQKVMTIVLKRAFKSKYFYYIVQNPNDEEMLNGLNIAPKNHVKLIKGSGISLKSFRYTKPVAKNYLEYLFPARILLDKGVMEFIRAAQSLKEKLYGKAKFVLAGDCDKDNLAALSKHQLMLFLDENYIEWIGFQKNMYSTYVNSDVVILPSYREGLPKSLIEACAIGRPIITTDVPGCRECVINGYNGYKIPVKEIEPLKQAILSLFQSETKRLEMGQHSREIAEQEFSIDIVIDQTFIIYNEILNRG